MEDIKTEGSVHIPWQGYRNPLPMPARLPTAYDIAPPAVSHAPLYHGAVSRNTYPPIPQQNHHDIPARQHKEQPGSISRPPLTAHQSYPSLKRAYQNFEEPTYNEQPQQEMYEGMPEPDSAAKPTIHPDHRLLSFSQLPDRHTILDQYGRPGTMEVSAQIHGMFFLSEIATSAGDNIIIQPELTCYRRNLFQISGSVSGPSGPLSVLTDRGQSVPIVAQELSISATESVDGHVIRLIVIPWKTPPPNSPEVPPNHEQEPPAIPLLQPAEGGPEGTGELMVHPIAWRRLQFRVATANNGRRKELQQHFVLRLSLVATLANGTKLCISEAATAPIVVRGRSPRNFQARKEIPLVGSSASPRGQTVQASPVDRKPVVMGETSRAQKPAGLELPKRPFQFDPSSFPSSPLARQGYPQWPTSQQTVEHSPIATTPTYPPSQASLPAYVQVQQNQPLPDSGRNHTPPVLKSQLSASSDANARRAYYSNASGPSNSGLALQFVDTNPRPTKSPRHAPDLSSLPLYPSFEERIAPSSYAVAPQNGEQQSVREYFPVSMPDSSWTSGGDGGVMYSTTMPPPLPPLHQQQQQYSFPSETYVKEEAPHQQPQQHYTWSAS